MGAKVNAHKNASTNKGRVDASTKMAPPATTKIETMIRSPAGHAAGKEIPCATVAEFKEAILTPALRLHRDDSSLDLAVNSQMLRLQALRGYFSKLLQQSDGLEHLESYLSDYLSGLGAAEGSEGVLACSETCEHHHQPHSIVPIAEGEGAYDIESEDSGWIDSVVMQTDAMWTRVLHILDSPKLTSLQKLTTLKTLYYELLMLVLDYGVEGREIREKLEETQERLERVEGELQSATRIKGRLESLCVDLQRDVRKLKAETELRASSSTTNAPNPLEFGAMVDYERLKEKHNNFIEQYDLREKHFQSVLKSKDLEIQLYQAKYLQQRVAAEKEFAKAEEFRQQLTPYARNEAELKSQLALYVEKFKQVEDTLGKSNDLFSTFRHEMEQMTTKLGKLEKENGQLQNKCATLSKNIIEMADERTKQNSSMETLKTQKIKLEQLCRTLQNERNSALSRVTELEAQLKELILEEVVEEVDRELIEDSAVKPPAEFPISNSD